MAPGETTSAAITSARSMCYQSMVVLFVTIFQFAAPPGGRKDTCAVYFALFGAMTTAWGYPYRVSGHTRVTCAVNGIKAR